MEHVTESRSKGFFRSSPSTAFDQYLHDIQKLPLIRDPAEERRLARLAQKGDEVAAERLVTANLRFVISYVKKYQGHGLDLSELVAIGNEGLLKAVKKFDPDQGVKFISYAVWWVRQAVLKALAEQTRSVRIPRFARLLLMIIPTCSRRKISTGRQLLLMTMMMKAMTWVFRFQQWKPNSSPKCLKCSTKLRALISHFAS